VINSQRVAISWFLQDADDSGMPIKKVWELRMLADQPVAITKN
jgi:hypothetical protein